MLASQVRTGLSCSFKFPVLQIVVRSQVILSLPVPDFLLTCKYLFLKKVIISLFAGWGKEIPFSSLIFCPNPIFFSDKKNEILFTEQEVCMGES